jgi:hypothetical protein
MKNYNFIIMVLALFLSFSLMSTRVQGAQDVEVVGHIAAIPCERNPKTICPDILILPRAHIEVYRFGGEKAASVDVPEQSGKDPKSDFSIHLAPDSYLFYIENKLNKQKTLFGPFEIPQEAKKIEVSFMLYSSYPDAKTPPREREMCFQKKIIESADASIKPAFDLFPEMECNLMMRDVLIPVRLPQ